MDIVPHEVDHIIPVKHGGDTDPGNLALACYLCNKHKGTDLASIDPESKAIALIYHPRRDVWVDHFRVEECRIVGRTPLGRATARLLQLNRDDRLAERMALDRAGLLSLPPGATKKEP